MPPRQARSSTTCQTHTGLLSLCLMLIATMAGPSHAESPEQHTARLQADARTILTPIEKAGGYAAIAERLQPWREKVAARIDAVPKKNYVAGDLPIDGGDGWILSGRRAKQLIYESDFQTPDAVGDRRYTAAERALLRTHRELAALGIRLLVVVAPDKCDIYPERIAPLPADVPTVHLKSKQLYLRLLHAGVEVIDPEPLLRAHKGKAAGPLYMQRDTHWSPAGARLVAHAVADRLDAFQKQNADLIERHNQRHTWDGDLAENWKRAGNPRPPKEKHNFIGVAQKNGKPITPDARAAVLVLGDSYSTYPYNGYFSFWAFLSQRLGDRVGYADQAGGGNNILHRFNRMPDKHRKHVKAIVLLFTSCSLYEVDFKEIPIRDAPALGPPVRAAAVTLLEDPPAIDPRTADYADAIIGIRARVDRGDGFPIEMVLYTPAMKSRRLLPAAGWKKDQSLTVDIRPDRPADQGGIMVLESDADPATPTGYVEIKETVKSN